MTNPKMAPHISQNLEILGNYMQDLATGAAKTGHLPSIGDVLGQRVDRLRLWRDGKSGRLKVKEVALPRRNQETVGLQFFSEGPQRGAFDTDLVALLDRISDPEIAVDLTLDDESGAVSIGVEVEPALEGQDLSALTRSSESGTLPSFDDEDFYGEYWTAEEAATELGVAKSTITRRIRANELIGFKLFKNALHVPKAQFDGQMVIHGIPEVLALFEDEHYAAWNFLTSEVFYGTDKPRPIDRLSATSKAELPDCLEELKQAKDGFDYGDHG